MPKLPNHLADPQRVAQEVYDFWVTVMKTDGVEGSEELPAWENMGDDWQSHLVESLKNNVTEPVKRFAEASAAELRVANAMFEKGEHPCYVCGTAEVSEAGHVCGGCYYTHVGGACG